MSITAGQKFRQVREQLGYTIREVEAASLRIAARHQNDDFAIPLSRLSDIETKGVVPSIYRLYSLSIIYGRDIRELLCWYAIDVNETVQDMALAPPPRSHISQAVSGITTVYVPMEIGPGFDLKRSISLSRVIQRWGIVPLAHLAHLQPEHYSYGYIGGEDFTMYPILLPGSFVQIDESRKKVQDGIWRSEYERPIYFLETHDGFVCSWCSVEGDWLIVRPHPLSPNVPRKLKHPSEAEVLGQVVGVAMRLDNRVSLAPAPAKSIKAES